MLTADLDYRLPEDLIAQRPAEPRDASRLMVVDAGTGHIEHRVFSDLPGFLIPGDAVVVNRTRVLPARLPVRRPGGGEAELLFLRELEPGRWEAMARPSKRLRPDMMLRSGEDWLRVVGPVEDGRWTVEGDDVRGTLERYGRMPLPPYIRPTPEAEARYQTVYAREPGSAAAPTAGLHFTQGTFEGIRRAGAEVHDVTLHVGVGTFQPVRAANLEDHRMHEESYSVPDPTAEAVGEDGRRVVAVGTTTARTLETLARTGRRSGRSGIFIYPGYRWRAVDAMVTNFHLPRSTLLAMIMSFAGTELVRRAYATAVERRYRFYSFGDAMLILNGGRGL